MNTRIFLCDRDGVINASSSDPTSPLFHILTPHSLVIKPEVREAFALMTAHGIPSILITRQRAIVKELINLHQLMSIHTIMQAKIEYRFLDILVEPAAFTKMALYDQVLARFPKAKLTLFDDDAGEREIAASKGISVRDGTNLYQAVCEELGVRS